MELITSQPETTQVADKPFPTTTFLDGVTPDGQPTSPPSPKKKSNFLTFMMVLLKIETQESVINGKAKNGRI